MSAHRGWQNGWGSRSLLFRRQLGCTASGVAEGEPEVRDDRAEAIIANLGSTWRSGARLRIRRAAPRPGSAPVRRPAGCAGRTPNNQTNPRKPADSMAGPVGRPRVASSLGRSSAGRHGRARAMMADGRGGAAGQGAASVKQRALGRRPEPQQPRASAPTWWSERDGPTRLHSEPGRETSQRPGYCPPKGGRAGRRQVWAEAHRAHVGRSPAQAAEGDSRTNTGSSRARPASRTKRHDALCAATSARNQPR